MEVIALSGPADSGKTHTINIVYQFLLDKGYKQVPGHFIHPEVFNFIGEKVYTAYDFSDILSHEKTLIGISTGGRNALSETLKSFEKAGCQKAICACHNTPESMHIVEQYKPHTFINKPVEENDSLKRINDYTIAKKILTLL